MYRAQNSVCQESRLSFASATKQLFKVNRLFYRLENIVTLKTDKWKIVLKKSIFWIPEQVNTKRNVETNQVL